MRVLRRIYKDKPDFKDVDIKKIFEQPMQANSQHSEHMVKNQQKDVEVIDLGNIGQMVPIAAHEAIYKEKLYQTSVEIVSQSADIIKIPTDQFVKIIQSNSHVMAKLKENCDERIKTIVTRMGQQIKMKEHVSTKMNALGPSNNTEWQYCPVNKLI